ncbi:unnamed protein product [Schistocephalus solidus]|uniref:Uncharacterized protein n=1 Tax=Schistocephalus solidus TaxID=70667 RepID=A0A183SQ51_SCHSO|nr:unnamed protein product [Schistocephalus solidus]
MDLFAANCDNCGLRINTKKTLVPHQPPPNTTNTAAHINVNGAQLKSVDTFTYLGSNLTRRPKVDNEIAHRITKVSQAIWSPSQHQTQDVQSYHLADAAVWSGELDDLQTAGAEAQPHPLQLPLQNT